MTKTFVLSVLVVVVEVLLVLIVLVVAVMCNRILLKKGTIKGRKKSWSVVVLIQTNRHVTGKFVVYTPKWPSAR